MTWEVDNDYHSFKDHPPHTTSLHSSFVSSNPSSILSSHFLSHSYPVSLSLSGVWSQFINAKKWARYISTFIIFPFPSTFRFYFLCHSSPFCLWWLSWQSLSHFGSFCSLWTLAALSAKSSSNKVSHRELICCDRSKACGETLPSRIIKQGSEKVIFLKWVGSSRGTLQLISLLRTDRTMTQFTLDSKSLTERCWDAHANTCICRNTHTHAIKDKKLMG